MNSRASRARLVRLSPLLRAQEAVKSSTIIPSQDRRPCLTKKRLNKKRLATKHLARKQLANKYLANKCLAKKPLAKMRLAKLRLAMMRSHGSRIYLMACSWTLRRWTSACVDDLTHVRGSTCHGIRALPLSVYTTKGNLCAPASTCGRAAEARVRTNAVNGKRQVGLRIGRHTHPTYIN